MIKCNVQNYTTACNMQQCTTTKSYKNNLQHIAQLESQCIVINEKKKVIQQTCNYLTHSINWQRSNILKKSLRKSRFCKKGPQQTATWISMKCCDLKKKDYYTYKSTATITKHRQIAMPTHTMILQRMNQLLDAKNTQIKIS